MDEKRDEKGRTLDEFLKEYDENRYRRPSVTVDMAVFTRQPSLSVLLIRRRNHPWIGGWALPGGFVNMDEELEAAAARELFEETGVKDVPLHEFGVFGAVDRDPRTRVISVGFLATVPENTLSFAAGDDAADAALFSIDEVVREAWCKTAETYRITLIGPRVIECRAKLVHDDYGTHPARFYAPGEGGLGGDHDLVLASALNELYRLNNNG